MKKLILSLIALAGAALAQQNVYGDRVMQSGATFNASGAAKTLPIKSGTLAGIPGTCTTNELYLATDITAYMSMYQCKSSAWEQMRVPSGATDPTVCAANDLFINTTATPTLKLCTTPGNPGTWTAFAGGSSETASTTYGFVSPMPYSTSTSGVAIFSATANEVRASLFYNEKPMSVGRIYVNVVGAVDATAVAHFGFYSLAGNRLASVANVALAATGNYGGTFSSVEIPRGWHWIAWANNEASTATTIAGVTLSSSSAALFRQGTYDNVITCANVADGNGLPATCGTMTVDTFSTIPQIVAVQ